MTLPDIRIYNTLTHEKKALEPLNTGQVGLYVCGPTVYSFVHIGNARTFTTFDGVVRYLRSRGIGVRYVRNYTDVDDKIIEASRATGEDALTLANRFVAEFEKDAKGLGLLTPDVSPRVSENMPEIVAIIQTLVEKQFAYVSGGDVYFEVGRFEGYGRLSGKKIEALESGHRDLRTAAQENLKRAPQDFALWKAAKPGEPSWPSPWSPGRPGWHIECSAMSKKFLGETFDLHGGGLDLIFPHHENERAQSEAANQKQLCVCWMHGNFLDLEGAKMSKSLGNVVRLRDALERVGAETLRYFFYSTHYRQQLDFGDKALSDADARLAYFYETIRKVDVRLESATVEPGPSGFDIDSFWSSFHGCMSDDFNFAGALGVLSGLFVAMNEWCDKPKSKDKALVLRTLADCRKCVDEVGVATGLFQETAESWLATRRQRLVAQHKIDVATVEQLIAARQNARAARDFAEADRLRAELKLLKVEIADSVKGTTWSVVADG